MSYPTTTTIISDSSFTCTLPALTSRPQLFPKIQKIVEEVQRKEVTTGELLTIVAMYPAHVTDPYLEALREALRIIEKQEETNEPTHR